MRVTGVAGWRVQRPSDWHVLDLDKDSTPWDPERVRQLARFLHADKLTDVWGGATTSERVSSRSARSRRAVAAGRRGANRRCAEGA
ncbi:hypothetical protein GCM10009536_28870 [Streptomyces thermocarboxydus]